MRGRSPPQETRCTRQEVCAFCVLVVHTRARHLGHRARNQMGRDGLR